MSVCAPVDMPMSCVLIGIGIGKGAAYLEEAGVLLGEYQSVHCDSELLCTTHAKHTHKRGERMCVMSCSMQCIEQQISSREK